MKIISKTLRLLPLFFMALALQGCSDDDDSGTIIQNPLNIVEIASANPNLSSLVAALQAADGDLVTVLSGSGPFTVLAPTNDAFDAFLGDNDLADIPTDVLQQVLLNHVISADLTSTDLVALGSGYRSTNADGAGGENLSIYFNTANGVSFNGVSSVVSGGADIDATNGTIHIVDAVIGLPNIVDHAVANSDLSDLVGALTAGGNTTFTDLLSTPGDFTVFAPDNNAFSNFTNPNGNDIPNVLSNHVIAGTTAISSSLVSGYVSTAAVNSDGDNLSMYISIDGGVMLNGSSLVLQSDIVATNGVIHVVSEVIDLPTIVTHAIANTNLSSLVVSLQEADGSAANPMLISTLSGDGPFTVFAPLDSAFTALLDSNSAWNSPADIDDDLLNSVLTHHVIAGANVRAEDLTDGIMPTTFEGDMITINLPGNDGNAAKITDGAGNSDIDIVLTNVQAINGVVHAIESVLIPDTMN
ncbi:fasciclin domain-containing protein [Psychroserpens algicola]|uniref:Fasciclin domain-containing protein n=1 Tax=Psychroserpens algicola TaxID=1719034 RepID=A0ABT0H5H9_9FLAO|nr:fasciclin domain-containing protein [Psychroserpens algicola]MCK8479606.1 fasciclin domain-containing protein [Psychroserpens algicola]